METKLLFKFRPITTANELARLIDSINNNRIYYPDYKKLNDPLESTGYQVEPSGWAGKGIIRAADEEYSYVAEKRSKYKILSLTEDCFSPCMWAHYTNDFEGVCIGYWKKGVFESARKLTYLSDAIHAKSTNEYGIVPDDKFDEELEESFYYKHSDWSYEKEWRIITKQGDNYHYYKPDELACIIFGSKISDDAKAHILASISTRNNLFDVYIGYQTFGINLLPIDTKILKDGSTPPFIRTVDQLIDNL